MAIGKQPNFSFLHKMRPTWSPLSNDVMAIPNAVSGRIPIHFAPGIGDSIRMGRRNVMVMKRIEIFTGSLARLIVENCTEVHSLVYSSMVPAETHHLEDNR